MAWYATLHMGWPLRVRRAVFRIGVKAAAMTSSSQTESFRPKKKKSEARGREDDVGESYIKSPLDREEGPVGP